MKLLKTLEVINFRKFLFYLSDPWWELDSSDIRAPRSRKLFRGFDVCGATSSKTLWFSTPVEFSCCILASPSDRPVYTCTIPNLHCHKNTRKKWSTMCCNLATLSSRSISLPNKRQQQRQKRRTKTCGSFPCRVLVGCFCHFLLLFASLELLDFHFKVFPPHRLPLPQEHDKKFSEDFFRWCRWVKWKTRFGPDAESKEIKWKFARKLLWALIHFTF